MGRGDKKSAKGKRTIGSYGVTRQKKKATYKPTATSDDKKTVVKKESEPKVDAKKPVAKKPAVAKKVKEETSTEE